MSNSPTSPDRQERLRSEFDHEERLQRRLVDVSRTGDLVGILHVLAEDLVRWGASLKEHLFDHFYVIDYADRLMSAPHPTMMILPSWLAHEFIGAVDAFQIIEFRKGRNHATAFAERLGELDRVRVDFAREVCDSGARYGKDIGLERFLCLDEKRCEVWKLAAAIANYVGTLANEFSRVETVKRSEVRGGPRRTPIVFISSTSEDLKEYRARAKEAAIQAGFLPRMMEYFGADGQHVPLEACLKRISGTETELPADVLVVLVAHRYGWVPPDQPGGERKSITWMECEEAKRCGKEVLAFLVDKELKWPHELREEHRLGEAAVKGEVTPELVLEVQDNLARLRQFKDWVNGQGLRATFTTPESLQAEVADALHKWRQRHPEFYPTAVELAEPAGDPKAYLESLREQTSHIDIRGLLVGSGKASQLRIDELYIPLRTMLPEVSVAGQEGKSHEITDVGGRGSVRVELHEALKHRVLLVIGDPGSGKTTFLRRISYLLCESLLGTQPDAAKTQLGLLDNPLPILIRLPDLAQHIAEARTRHEGPKNPESPRWLSHCLAAQSDDGQTRLTEAFFDDQLKRGRAIVLLDGLDEASSYDERLRLANLFENAARAYKSCRFVLTSRPITFRDELALPKCVQVQIDDLDEDVIEAFLGKWCHALFSTSPGEAQSHCRELTGALRARPEIRRMARNPVMLTALAVVHWNEKRLPEQRADLYESILLWLARARKQRPGRFPPERCINVHQELALAMQDHPQGRQVQIPRFDAARAIASQWRELPEEERASAAEAYLKEEELDSGIIVSRGNQLRFWHLTFQEYLAARALAGREQEEQRERLLLNNRALPA